MLKNKQVLTTSLSTIWENTDGCDEQYRFASALYLMSVISQTYSLIIDRVISAPGNGKEVVDGLNDVVSNFLFLSNDINSLLCAVVVAASCLL